MTEGPCPETARLRLFARGLLPDDELERIGLHVTACHTCVTWLDTHEDVADGLEEQLRSIVRAGTDPEVPRELLLAARAPVRSSSFTAPPSIRASAISEAMSRDERSIRTTSSLRVHGWR